MGAAATSTSARHSGSIPGPLPSTLPPIGPITWHARPGYERTPAISRPRRSAHLTKTFSDSKCPIRAAASGARASVSRAARSRVRWGSTSSTIGISSTRSWRPRMGPGEELVPAIGSTAVGPLGAMHLPRLWLKHRLHGVGRLPEAYRHGVGGFDGFVSDGLGFDGAAFATFVEAGRPDYLAAEAWVRANASNAGASGVDALNEKLRAAKMPAEHWRNAARNWARSPSRSSTASSSRSRRLGRTAPAAAVVLQRVRALLRLARPAFLLGGFAGFGLGAAVAHYDGFAFSWAAYLWGS